MVNSEYSMDTHKSMKISIGTIMRNPKMLKFIPDYFKTKKYVGMQLKACIIYQDMFLVKIRLSKCVIQLF